MKPSQVLSQEILLTDDSGVAFGLKVIDGKPRFSCTDYLFSIAEGEIANHVPFVKLGFSPSCTANVNTDVWSYAATQPVYLFPTAEMGMEVLSSDNTVDIATVIHSGTSTGGSLTSLISSTENFLTTTAIGDIVVLDKSGASPEYGYITAVVDDTTLTVAGGFSSGGSGSGRAYSILDKSAKAGAQAVKIEYLDGDYVEHREIILLNGTTVVPTVNLDIFRINSFRVIATGANAIPTGNLTIRHIDNTPVYSFITAGFTRARNAMYTVPAGKVLFVTNLEFGNGTTGKASLEFARVTTRANVDPMTKFKTDGIFFPFSDIVCQNSTVPVTLAMPTKLPAGTDIKISYIASDVSICTSIIRGWIETV